MGSGERVIYRFVDIGSFRCEVERPLFPQAGIWSGGAGPHHSAKVGFGHRGSATELPDPPWRQPAVLPPENPRAAPRMPIGRGDSVRTGLTTNYGAVVTALCRFSPVGSMPTRAVRSVSP